MRNRKKRINRIMEEIYILKIREKDPCRNDIIIYDDKLLALSNIDKYRVYKVTEMNEILDFTILIEYADEIENTKVLKYSNEK